MNYDMPPEENNETVTGSGASRLEKTVSKKKKKKNIIYDILIAICLIVFAVSAFYLDRWMWDNYKSGKITEETKEIAEVETEKVKTKGGKVIAGMEGDETEGEKDYLDLDVEKLYAANPDAVGWIRVNGTLVDYPVVQAGNNDFYLRHDFKGDYSDAGCPFMDYRNNGKDIKSNKNVIIYAHARKDRSMFGSLDYCLQPWWYGESSFPYIRYTTLDEKTVWKIFAVYTVNVDEFYYIRTEFADDADFMKFIDEINKINEHNFGVDVSADDTIMTLSTCSYGNKDRLVVQAKLIQSEAR